MNYFAKQLDTVTFTKKIKVIMLDSVLEKIHTLNSLISQVEWSGILLYSVEGTIQDPANMQITLQDIILMDKGTKAYTEYSFTEKKRDQEGYSDRHIDYCLENEEACHWSIGHIHSHNTFGVFFSGTDMSELNDNAPSHNIYLSLIVNNALDFEAKIAFTARAEAEAETTYIALDEKGKKYVIAPTKLKTFKEKLFIYNCDIESNKEEIKIKEESFFDRNVREVLAYVPAPAIHTYAGKGSIGATVAASAVKNTGSAIVTNTPKLSTPGNPYIHPSVRGSEHDEEEEEMIPEFSPEMEDACYTILNNGIAPVNNNKFENLLKNLENNKKFAKTVTENVITNLTTTLNEIFGLEGGIESVTSYVLTVDEIVEYLELYQAAYPEPLGEIIKIIRNFLDKFILENEKIETE